jgi:NitT/TauT family transport system ATP-binding protein
MNKIIEVKGLNKVFLTERKKEVHALRDIDLSIEEQEFVCLLGPSGSGKSTLLRLMEGLIEATTGEIKVMNRTIIGPILEAGMVFQEYSLMPWKNIIDNVAFGLELRKMSKKNRYKIANEILNKFGLGDFTKSFPHELSGGMKQRAAIARAIATSPKILYMDEPFGALDAYTRFQMQKDLIEFWLKEKRTIVFVTHSVEEAIFLGTRIILMSPRPGEVAGDYSIELPYPRNRWSKQFGSYFQQIMEQLDEVSVKK